MAELQIIPQNRADACSEPLPRKDYTTELLRRAALTGSISADRLNELKAALQRAAAERAAAYTRGRSTTVTRAQAEAFYRSVFCQLDAVLLEMQDDAQAEEALHSTPLDTLLEAGQLRTLQLYDEAKEDFRAAYRLTEPYATAFFKELLNGFEKFCTKFDARFRAFDTKVDPVYPLLGDQQITEDGVTGTAKYYRALRLEGEFLRTLDPDAMQSMLKRYAAKFRTAPEMIAENLAGLALRHMLVNALGGASGVCVTADCAAHVQEQQKAMPAAQAAAALIPQALSPEAKAYLAGQLSALTETLETRLAAGTLAGWLSAAD